MNQNSLLQQLRQITAPLHERIEQKNPARAILDHSIGLEAYKQLLLQNYAAYSRLEPGIAAVLPFFKADKAARLYRDLVALNITPQPEPDEFEINSVAEAFGAAYVLEGSALGGMLIAKHLSQCAQLKALPSQHFFSGDKASLAPWKLFQQELAVRDFNEPHTAELLSKARETFLFFERTFEVQIV